MAFYKNKAGQRLYVHVTAGSTGIAASITGYLSKDGAEPAAFSAGSAHPTELDADYAPGWYFFLPSQEESNADALVVTVAGAVIDTVEPIYTENEIRDADLHEVNGLPMGTIADLIDVWSGAVCPTRTLSDGAITAATFSEDALTAIRNAQDPLQNTDVSYSSGMAGDAIFQMYALIQALAVSVAAIKTKTDSLTFTVAGKVDSTAVLDSLSTAGALALFAQVDAAIKNPVNDCTARPTVINIPNMLRFQFDKQFNPGQYTKATGRDEIKNDSGTTISTQDFTDVNGVVARTKAT